MSTSYRLTEGALPRLLAVVFAAALALALVPLTGVHAQENGDDNDNDEENGLPEGVEIVAPEEGESIGAIRYAGEQRFDTAAQIALTNFPDGAENAVIARHDEWPDALAGGYLAGVFEAPVLLVSQNNLQDDTLTALEELGVSNVLLLGQTEAIGAGNEQALSENYEVTRIGGETRYETAAEIATDFSDEVGEHDGRRTAIVASGIAFADALAMGTVAASQGFPILLTPSTSLHPAAADALEELEIEQVLLAGESDAISEDVADAIREIVEADDDGNDENGENGENENAGYTQDEDDDTVIRLGGETRIETAAEIAAFGIDNLGFESDGHGWARGNEFPDALAIGPVLGGSSVADDDDVNDQAGFAQVDDENDEFAPSPLLLTVTPNRFDSGANTNAQLTDEVACDTFEVQLAGGLEAIGQSVEDEILSELYCDDVAHVELEAETDTTETGEEVDLTALVTDNTFLGREDVTVTFEIETATPEAATVEFDGEEGESATADTDADGNATVSVSSDDPAEVTFIASAERQDGTVVFSNTVTVRWLPADPGALPDVDVFALDLSSDNEVGDGTAEGADPAFEGEGTLFLAPDFDLVCWELSVDLESGDDQETGSFEAWAEGAGIPGSHIHGPAPVGENAGIVVLLGTVSDEDGTDEGCDFTDYDLAEIVDNPAQYYGNVHTDVYPAGIVRDQLG